MAFYFWESKLLESDCERIIAEKKDCDFSQGKTGKSGSVPVGTTADPDQRNSEVVWLEEKHIMNLVISALLHEANQKIFHYDLTGFEHIQFSRYREGFHYDWHKDCDDSEMTSNKDGLVRKLSVMVQLTNPDDYEGGEFEIFDGIHEPIRPAIRAQGSVIIINSYEWHRVTPVTKGERYSIVAWAIGPLQGVNSCQYLKMMK